jgi:hypothetical protein
MAFSAEVSTVVAAEVDTAVCAYVDTSATAEGDKPISAKHLSAAVVKAVSAKRDASTASDYREGNESISAAAPEAIDNEMAEK